MTRRSAVRRAREALEMVKAKQVAVVLNKVSRQTDAYSYCSYYYYHQYRSE